MATLQCDVAVVGAGPAGLAAAIALGREGFTTCLIGTPASARDGRTVALFDGSIRFFRAIGLMPQLVPVGAPIRTIRIIDDTDSLFRAPPLALEAREIGLETFGFNVENADLVQTSLLHAGSIAALTLVEGAASEVVAGERTATVRLGDGSDIEAKLVVGADGRNSIVRRAAAIAIRTWSYPQAALTTLVAHERPHDDVSVEFHRRSGPFTLVPLQGKRSSLVWVTSPADAKRLAALDDDELARAVERQAHSLWGTMRIDGPRSLWPLSGTAVTRFAAPRIALLGEAAHVFPPIGAQGLNLGLRDAASLRDALVDARRRHGDIGADKALRDYQRSRSFDVRMRTAMVDGLNRTLLAGYWPADLMRGVGMLALGLLGPLRRAAMREGLTPSVAPPRLMRRETPSTNAVAF